MSSEMIVAEIWASTVCSAQSHAASAAATVGEGFSELINREVQRFVSQSQPETIKELNLRTQQSISLSGVISAIQFANMDARRHPEVRQGILELTTRFCEQVSYDVSIISESLRLTGDIQLLIENHRLRAQQA